ncbi:MAG: hypothetical protein AAB706_01525 [Patescibacteria group bacterium]
MNTQDISREILNEIEQDKIIQLCADTIAFNALKKYILAVCYKQGVVEKGGEHKGTVNFALNLAWGATQPNGMPRTDEELGQNLRALTYAVQLVESGFKELSELRKPEPEEVENINKAE